MNPLMILEMIKSAWGWMVRNDKLVAMLILAAYIAHCHIALHDTRADLKAAEDKNASLTTLNSDMAAAIKTQNASIEKFQQEAAARAAAAVAAIDKAKGKAAADATTVGKILASPQEGDDCQNSARLINAYMDTLQ